MVDHYISCKLLPALVVLQSASPQCTSGYSLCSVFSTRRQTTFCVCDQFCLCFGFKQPTKAWYINIQYIYIFCSASGKVFLLRVREKTDHSPVIPPQNLCCYKLGHTKTRNTAIGPRPGPAQPILVLWGTGRVCNSYLTTAYLYHTSFSWSQNSQGEQRRV